MKFILTLDLKVFAVHSDLYFKKLLVRKESKSGIQEKILKKFLVVKTKVNFNCASKL